MTPNKPRANAAPDGFGLHSFLGPLLLLSAIGFVFLLAMGANIAEALIMMLPAA